MRGLVNVAIIADVQLGNHKRFGGAVVGSINARCRMILDVLSNAADRIVEERCTHLVVAGDLFDYVRPEAPLIAEVQRIFQRLRYADVNIILLRGNHDMVSTREGDTALAPLHPLAFVVDSPVRMRLSDAAELLAVPFQPGRVKDWLPPAVRALLSPEGLAGGADAATPPAGSAAPARLLALHMGIKDEKTPPWLSSSQGAIDIADLFALSFECGITAVAAGDWHSRRAWLPPPGAPCRTRVLQVGALVPTGWDNPGIEGYGTLAFWRPGEVKPLTWEELRGPRFVKVRTQDEREAAFQAAKHCTLFVSQVAGPEDVAAETEFWRAAAELHPLGGVEVLPDEGVAKSEALQAATIARSAETTQEALNAFVKNMPLKDGVRRDAVLTRSREYLK